MPNGRGETANYRGLPHTRFQWAENDNVVFERETDMAYLAQALEYHTHKIGYGLPVASEGIAANSITETAYASNSIPERAYKDASIVTSKIKQGAITDDKMASQKVNRNGGDTMQYDLRINRVDALTPHLGYLRLGTGENMLAMENGQLKLQHDNTGGPVLLQHMRADGEIIFSAFHVWTQRPSNPATGILRFGNAGANIYWDGTRFTANDIPLIPVIPTVVQFPLAGACMFRNQTKLTEAGPRFAVDPYTNGRLLVGADGTFPVDVTYGSNWLPMAGLGMSAPIASYSVMSPGTGTNTGSLNTHVHVLTGTSTNWYPPMLSVLWAARIS